ncbi:16S rRNA processing protein RimM [Mariprofundus ferrinatatus]|uniref:Ribosome maturation factor RimM n=1 Tax=Mariprofundus ferrinatatus TaxID=1921087 RepID=A0A2K8LAK8_9PROT|nr:ribosome maturation factor RimM [Mariprofundus ferrinatatus]ATX81286.1 16S rRNA processing protein RimM [Mariprofundus ferrinatatus]
MALEPSYLHVGDILGTHGLKGTLTLYSHTRPASAVAGYSCWWVGESGELAKPYQVKRCWQHGKRMLADLEGIADCNSAEKLKGQKIWVPLSEVEVDEGEYLWEELIGCEVILDESDELLGTVVALEDYGAQDNLVVKAPDDAESQGEWLIPFIEEVIVEVDLEEGIIAVDLPDGMDACFTPRS